MNTKQKVHLEQIKSEFCLLVEKKYSKGAIEHGGNLTDMSLLGLLNEAIAEAIDIFTYLSTLKLKVAALQSKMFLHEQEIAEKKNA